MQRKRDKNGNIVVKVPFSNELPPITLKREIAGTEYSVSGSYDGKNTSLRVFLWKHNCCRKREFAS